MDGEGHQVFDESALRTGPGYDIATRGSIYRQTPNSSLRKPVLSRIAVCILRSNLPFQHRQKKK